MNQKTLIWVIVVLVVLGGGWYIYSSYNSAAPVSQTATTTTSSTGTTGTPATGTTAPQGTSTTFTSIFTQSGNHECTYSGSSSSSQSSSVVYISGGKMRGEFRSTVNGVSTATIMVYSGGSLYTWTEGMTTGKKTTLTSLADLPQVIPQDLTSGAIYGTGSTNVSWDCHDWATDATLLTVPAYVTFTASS